MAVDVTELDELAKCPKCSAPVSFRATDTAGRVMFAAQILCPCGWRREPDSDTIRRRARRRRAMARVKARA